MSGRTHGDDPNPPGDAQEWDLQHGAAVDIGPLVPRSLCPTPPGVELFLQVLLCINLM